MDAVKRFMEQVLITNKHNLWAKVTIMPEEHYGYILVEREKWWNSRHDKNRKSVNTQVFVRRGLVGPKEAQKLLFYVKLPVGKILGYGDFLERIIGTADELWNIYGSETVFESRDQYDDFVEGRSNVTFLRFKNLRELEKEKQISWKHLSAELGIKKMPNGGRYLSRETVNSMLRMEL
jgi:predicted transcriptional regulator